MGLILWLIVIIIICASVLECGWLLLIIFIASAIIGVIAGLNNDINNPKTN